MEQFDDYEIEMNAVSSAKNGTLVSGKGLGNCKYCTECIIELPLGKHRLRLL